MLYSKNLHILLAFAVIVELKSMSVLMSDCESCAKVWSPEAANQMALHAKRDPMRATQPGMACQMGARSLRGSSTQDRPSPPRCIQWTTMVMFISRIPTRQSNAIAHARTLRNAAREEARWIVRVYRIYLVLKENTFYIFSCSFFSCRDDMN